MNRIDLTLPNYGEQRQNSPSVRMAGSPATRVLPPEQARLAPNGARQHCTRCAPARSRSDDQNLDAVLVGKAVDCPVVLHNRDGGTQAAWTSHAAYQGC